MSVETNYAILMFHHNLNSYFTHFTIILKLITTDQRISQVYLRFYIRRVSNLHYIPHTLALHEVEVEHILGNYYMPYVFRERKYPESTYYLLRSVLSGVLSVVSADTSLYSVFHISMVIHHRG